LTLPNDPENTFTFVVKYDTAGTPLWAAYTEDAENPSISTSFKSWA
jgi:hypothetical protein